MFLITFAATLLVIALNFGKAMNILGWLLSAALPILVGLAIAFILNVPLSFFEDKVFAFMDKSKFKFVRKAKMPICLILIIVLVVLLLVLVVFVIVPTFFEAVKDIVEIVAGYAADLPDWVSAAAKKLNIPERIIKDFAFDSASVMDSVVTYIKNKASTLLSKTASFTISVASGVFDLFLSFIVALYVLCCKKRMLRFSDRMLTNFTEESFADGVRTVCKLAYNSFSKFIAGQFLDSVILGLLCYIGMTVFGFPHAGVVSVLVGIAQLIPIVGGVISAASGSLLMLTESPMTAVTFLVFVIVIQQLEGNLIYPRIVGQQVGIPGILVISTVILGGNTFGIPGILIGIPLVSTLFAIIKLLMRKKEDEKKKQADETDSQSQGDTVL